MSDQEVSGMTKHMITLEERSNRTTLIKAADNSDFTVSFRDISHPHNHELVDAHGWPKKKYCRVDFLISRGNQDFVVPIFIKTDSVSAIDYIKEAAHRLHLDLARLAEQTAHFKLRDEDAPPDEDRPEERDLSEFL